MTADEVIRALGLVPHPEEGGFYRETWRSPFGFGPAPGFASRSAGTAIYYLMTPRAISRMHRLPGDEVFHHYAGDPVEMLLLRPDGGGELVRLGCDLATGARPQVIVPGGWWQGSLVVPDGPSGWALLGTTMAPGFAFPDYAHGDVEDLAARYPDWAGPIRARA